MDRNPGAIPAARTDSLVTTETAGEVLVYDQASHHIHHLNHASVLVWQRCTGDATVEEIAARAGLPVESVRMAVGMLAAADLLERDVPGLPRGTRGSRRALLRRAGVAAGIAIPAVVSVSAPLAAQTNSPSSGWRKCSNFGCHEVSCSLACASASCPAGCQIQDIGTCRNFDGPFVPDMCGYFCNCS